MRRIRILRGVLVILLALLMGFIFHLSAEPAETSDQTSGGLILWLAGLFDPSFAQLSPERQMQKVQLLQNTVRSLAHLTEYMLLGGLTGALILTFRSGIYTQGIGWLLCVAFAIGDEVHQAFVPGRAFQISDILTDAGGALLGILAVFAAAALVKRLLLKRKETENGKQ